MACGVGCFSLVADRPPGQDGADSSAGEIKDGSDKDGSDPADARFDVVDLDVVSDVREAETGSGLPVQDAGADGPVGTADFYVGLPPPDGGLTYATIGDALSAANASLAAIRTIHLAAGTYSVNETFPLVLRGVSLVGAGPSTIVTGVGSLGISPPPLPSPVASHSVTAAIVVGDATERSTIAHLSLRAPEQSLTGSEGIVCDRSDTASAGPTVPNTLIDDVTIDGFEIALNVTASQVATGESGCAVRITNSVLENGAFGVVAAGSYSSFQLVSVAIGDGTADAGNVLQNFHDAPGSIGAGAGFTALDWVTGVNVTGNTFSESDQGIWVIQSAVSSPSSGMTIARNDIGSMDNSGIELWGPILVDAFVGNTVHDSPSPGGSSSFLGAGLVLQSNGTAMLPSVQLAQHNSFVGSDVGVFVRSNESNIANVKVNFGTSQDPGGNVFRCNYSEVTRTDGNGGDVLVHLPGATNVVLPFEGNTWDHAPPSGNDFVIQGGVVVDTADASAADSPACPDGSIP
jgi:hypothetical protein